MLAKLTQDKKKSLQVVILTPFRGPGNLPAIYGDPEEPPKIRGYVELITTEDIKAGDLDLYFRVKSYARWARKFSSSCFYYLCFLCHHFGKKTMMAKPKKKKSQADPDMFKLFSLSIDFSRTLWRDDGGLQIERNPPEELPPGSHQT